MYNLGSLTPDELFRKWDADKIWARYCGFLDLPLEHFMVIQEALLMDQIDLASRSELGQKVMKGERPRSVEEFRQKVPLTTYDDYEPYLSEKKNDAMPARPVIWGHTSGRAGLPKWAPYTQGNLERLANDTISAFVLSSATRKGDVQVHEGAKVVLNLPPVPYTTGIMAVVAAQRIRYRPIPPLDEAENMDFQQRIEQGFRVALRTGADYAGSIAVVLARIGERFGELGTSSRSSLLTLHPLAVLRLLRAKARSKLAGRAMLPRDLWRLKGLVCGGTDVSILAEKIEHYWGVRPLDAYVATETGYVAMQAWNKKAMTLVPYSNFYEFIPVPERPGQAAGDTPEPVMLDQVEPGKVYEIVFTNFHGGPFLRYRIGDLVKFVALEDSETGVRLPQMVFQSRTADIIDLAGFARLDEKTLWRAIHNINVPYEDWTVRKEPVEGKPVLHIYLEPRQNAVDSHEVERLIDQQLIGLDRDYRDLRKMTRIEPIRVTLLRRGTLDAYFKEKQAAGFDLAHLKPAHLNPSEETIRDLLRLSSS